jgi:hypothetical protein
MHIHQAEEEKPKKEKRTAYYLVLLLNVPEWHRFLLDKDVAILV